MTARQQRDRGRADRLGLAANHGRDRILELADSTDVGRRKRRWRHHGRHSPHYSPEMHDGDRSPAPVISRLLRAIYEALLPNRQDQRSRDAMMFKTWMNSVATVPNSMSAAATYMRGGNEFMTSDVW